MADVHTKEKIRQKLKQLKSKLKHRKIEGDPKIRGVSKPKRGKRGKPKEQETKKLTAVGPRGGKYKVGPGGKRQYQGKKSMSIAVAEVLEDILVKSKVTEFIGKFKRSK